MSERLTQVKIGERFHYLRDPVSGFWINQFPADPMSATLTSKELASLVRDNVKHGEDLIKKMHGRIGELVSIVLELENNV